MSGQEFTSLSQQKSMPSFEEIRESKRGNGHATILAIGTANPPNYIYQANYPDYYFRVTNTEHMINLKDKFKRICDRSMIRKRHIYLTEDMLKENPNICTYMGSSLNTRQDMMVKEVPRLGKEAAVKAIKEWGQSLSKITHLIFCTSTTIDMPSADYQLAKLLDLSPSVQRFMLYMQGCNGGGTVLRLAKDIAENNSGARVLAVCCDITTICFRGPAETHCLVAEAIFGDGAAAVIVGADPDVFLERPLFHMVWAGQTLLPNSEKAVQGNFREAGLVIQLQKVIPDVVSNNIEKALVEAFNPLGISDWNSIFWVAHPGGPKILNQIQSKLELKEEKLATSRKMLSEFGNMVSVSVLFVLDEMRKNSVEDGKPTTGEGLEWGVLFGFGPGITIETIVLHSVTLNN